MPDQIRSDLSIGFDPLVNLVGIDAGTNGGGDQALQIELVSIKQQPDHRLLIVGISANIR